MPGSWDQIAQTLRTQIRRLVSLRGLAWSGLVTLGMLWAAGLLDWLLHLDHPLGRALLSGVVAVGIGGTLWRTLWRPLHVPLSDVDIARTIERRFPRWGNRLSSAAQFRDEDYAQRLGSPTLQQAMTADVDARLHEIDPQQVLDVRPTQRLLLVATALGVVGLTAALWQRSAAATALTRLALPFADVQWPRTTQLLFLDDDLQPTGDRARRTAAGEPLALYLENRLGPLPDDARLVLQLPDGRSELRLLKTTMLRDEAGEPHDVGIASLTAHAGPIRFRAIGGDDLDMSWHTIEVVPPPALSRVTLSVTPPAYTSAPPQVLNGAGQIEALVGSRVAISAVSNTPLARADLRREGHPPQAMPLKNGRRRFDVEFEIETAGHGWYWFDIADEHGLAPSHPPRYELRGLADRKPSVFIDQPAGDITLTHAADLPLRIIARDDLGITTLRLVSTTGEAAPVLWPLELPTPLPTDETVEWTWNLAALGLSSGDRIAFHAEAVDAFDLDTSPAADASQSLPETTVAPLVVRPEGEVGQVGRSAPRRIVILSEPEKRQELAARQLGILDTLRQVQEQQSRAAESVAGLRIQAELAEHLQEEDLDLLKQTELEQQQIRERLTDPATGASQEVDRVRKELDHNQIDDPQLATRLDQLQEDLRTLTDEMLPGIEQSLARARKATSAEAGEPTAPQARQQLHQAEQTQSRALELLALATEQLGGWQRQYEVTSAVDEMIADQSELSGQTQQVGRQTLTKRPDALTPQQQADLARLSDRQRRLAARLDDLLQQASRPDQPAQAEDAMDEAVQQALQRLQERQTVGHMHRAAESLRQNNIAATSAAQQQVTRDLREFGELLQSGDQDMAETLLSSLEEQVAEVETLRKQQSELVRQTQHALGPSADPDRQQQLQRLQKRQQQLAEQVDELARQLRRQQLRQAAQSAARAARRMRQARQTIEDQQPEQSAETQREALDDLAQLADELAQQHQQIERELARQQIEQLADELQELADQQDTLTTQTTDLDEQQQQRGSWSRSLRKQLHEVTGEQSQLVERLDELRRSVTAFPVVEVALQQAADPMRPAIERLQENDVGPATRQHQRRAHQRLLGLVEVTRPQQSSGDPTGRTGPQPQTPPNDGQSEVPQLLTTQLRLLRQLQADVQQRTVDLAGREPAADASDTSDLADERAALVRDQARIAELTRALLEQLTDVTDAPDTQEQP